MIIVHIDDIKVPENRFRREFDAKYLADLEDSITRNGLFHPIVCEQNPDDGWTLRAGECRLKVLRRMVEKKVPIRYGIEEMSPGLVPINELLELSPDQRIEIEVEENIRRKDFAWQERVTALARYHELRSRQNPGQTLQATASEVAGKQVRGSPVSEISQAIVLHKHLANPEVAKAKDAKEALKVIRKQAEAQHAAKLAKTFDLSRVQHRLVRGDARTELAKLAPESFDCICTDPPYGIEAHNFGEQAATGHDYEDTKKKWKELLTWLPEELSRVAKKRAHCYIFCDQRNFIELETHMVLAGWRVFPTMLIWYKGNGMLPLPKHGPRRTYETILYAYKGDRETLAVRNDCIVNVPPVRDLKHGAQKPVALYIDLLGRSCNPGDIVLDCFGGTGPILVAANRLRLVATYIEVGEKPFNIATSRANVKDIDDGAEADDGIDIDFGADDGA